MYFIMNLSTTPFVEREKLLISWYRASAEGRNAIPAGFLHHFAFFRHHIALLHHHLFVHFTFLHHLSGSHHHLSAIHQRRSVCHRHLAFFHHRVAFFHHCFFIHRAFLHHFGLVHHHLPLFHHHIALLHHHIFIFVHHLFLRLSEIDPDREHQDNGGYHYCSKHKYLFHGKSSFDCLMNSKTCFQIANIIIGTNLRGTHNFPSHGFVKLLFLL